MKIFNKFIQGVWNVGIIEKKFDELIKNPNDFEIKWVKHKYKDRFFADPFLYKVDDKNYYILVEEFPFYSNVGFISLLTVDKKSMKLICKKKVIKESWHLSYPFVLGDKIIPEAYRSGVSTAYRFDGDKVVNKSKFFDSGIIDQTLVEYNGNEFLFATNENKPLASLSLYYRKKGNVDWKAHPLNPVKDDIKTARPGGKAFYYNEMLLRPVQDSEERYGRKIRIMRIDKLSESEFEETEICSFSSDKNPPYNLALHTFNVEQNFIVVDGYREYHSLFIRPMCLKLPKLMKYFGEKNED